MKPTAPLRRLLCLPLLASCQSLGAGTDEFQIYATQSGQAIELEQMVSELQDADVIFLGEEHDNNAGHRLQLETIEALAGKRRDLIISLEQFEADVQYLVDLYLAGGISEAIFLEHSRPWNNYKKHYKPIVEFAKRHDIPVIAANIPRPIASTVAHEGLDAIADRRIAPAMVWTDEEAYAEFFAKIMGRESMDESDKGLVRWFAAQCVKDEKMAESISRAFVRARAKGQQPLVVHLNGKFHSNNRLGTVSRLQRRHPRLDIRVIGMNSTRDRQRELTPEEAQRGDYMWLVAPR